MTNLNLRLNAGGHNNFEIYPEQENIIDFLLENREGREEMQIKAAGDLHNVLVEELDGEDDAAAAGRTEEPNSPWPILSTRLELFVALLSSLLQFSSDSS